jgi:hypothetical protein
MPSPKISIDFNSAEEKRLSDGNDYGNGEEEDDGNEDEPADEFIVR